MINYLLGLQEERHYKFHFTSKNEPFPMCLGVVFKFFVIFNLQKKNNSFIEEYFDKCNNHNIGLMGEITK